MAETVSARFCRNAASIRSIRLESSFRRHALAIGSGGEELLDTIPRLVERANKIVRACEPADFKVRNDYPWSPRDKPKLLVLMVQ